MRVGLSFDEAVGGLMGIEEGIRLVVLRGLRGSIILDDTYNASPDSTLAALNLLHEMEGRRVAVLGDMLELGSFEEDGHRLVGRRAAAVANWLITVGSRARILAEEARAAGMPGELVESFDTNEEAIRRLERGLQPGDFVLVKGSRGARLDEVVDALRVAA
jgi:UDP-N-acetylmuramoyl-tripeptide--D-alanyl-D-alanine ligase